MPKLTDVARAVLLEATAPTDVDTPHPKDLPDVVGLVVAVDTETSGLHGDDGARVAVVSIAYRDPETEQVVAQAFAFDQGRRDKVPQMELALEGDPNIDDDGWYELLEWLGDQRLVFHNAKFDLHMLRWGTRSCEGIDLERAMFWDTMIVQNMIDPLHAVGLKPTAERLGLTGGDERDKEEALKRYLKRAKLPTSRYDLVPWGIISPYAARDAELTLLLYEMQWDRVNEGECTFGRVAHKIDVTRTLYRIERRGLVFDAGRSLDAADQLQARADKLAATLPFRPTLPAAKRYFFDEKQIRPIKTTPKGAAQLDDETLTYLVNQGVDHAATYAEYGRMTRAVNMWYRGYPEAIGDDGRLRTVFRQTKVKSGRMSVERLQLQAIPKNDKAIEGIPTIRSMFGAPPGYELWNLDLSQAELRVAAKYARCLTMLEMLEGGADIHGVTTQEVFGIEPDHRDWKYKRDIAKRLTFGGIFQIGWKTFQATLSKLAGIHWPDDECQTAIKRWRGLYPEFGTAYRRAEKVVERQGYVRVMPGTQYEERSYFGPRDFPNSAWNRIVQGSLALYLQIWLVDAEQQLHVLGAPEALVLTVHDSLVLELPAERAPEIAELVAQRGADRATELFGIGMKVDVGEWHG